MKPPTTLVNDEDSQFNLSNLRVITKALDAKLVVKSEMDATQFGIAMPVYYPNKRRIELVNKYKLTALQLRHIHAISQFPR